jgi:hypothetical protein
MCVLLISGPSCISDQRERAINNTRLATLRSSLPAGLLSICIDRVLSFKGTQRRSIQIERAKARREDRYYNRYSELLRPDEWIPLVTAGLREELRRL